LVSKKICNSVTILIASSLALALWWLCKSFVSWAGPDLAAMASRGKLGEWENPDTVVRSEDWQEAIRKGCEMVQIASERKVRELERRLDHLKTEAETLRRKGEELRTIHLNLESDLKDSKNQNKAQMESNKKLAQEVFAMRTDMSKLGQFRASLDQAVSYVDSRK